MKVVLLSYSYINDILVCCLSIGNIKKTVTFNKYEFYFYCLISGDLEYIIIAPDGSMSVHTMSLEEYMENADVESRHKTVENFLNSNKGKIAKS